MSSAATPTLPPPLPPPPAPIPIPLFGLEAQRARLGDRLEAAVRRVLAHGRFILGPEVADLEVLLAAMTGAAHCVGCASGTDALALALAAAGVGPGDAVIVPALTFIATASAVVRAGAVPVFADVEADTALLAPARLDGALAAARAAGLRPRAVVAVDLWGQPADYRALSAFARTHGLGLFADAAQSFGAARDGTAVGTLADATAVSFFPTKPLGGCGDGGAVFTDNAALAAVVRSLREHGRGREKYENLRIGYNARLDTLQAALLLEKAAVFDAERGRRRAAAARYADLLRETGGRVAPPAVAPGAEPIWALYTVQVPDRARVMRALEQAGIGCGVYYPRPLHRQPACRDFPVAAGGCAVAEHLADRVLSLPMHPDLAAADQERVAAALARAVG